MLTAVKSYLKLNIMLPEDQSFSCLTRVSYLEKSKGS